MNKTDSIFTEGATFIEDSCIIEFIKRVVETHNKIRGSSIILSLLRNVFNKFDKRAGESKMVMS